MSLRSHLLCHLAQQSIKETTKSTNYNCKYVIKYHFVFYNIYIQKYFYIRFKNIGDSFIFQKYELKLQVCISHQICNNHYITYIQLNLKNNCYKTHQYIELTNIQNSSKQGIDTYFLLLNIYFFVNLIINLQYKQRVSYGQRRPHEKKNFGGGDTNKKMLNNSRFFQRNFVSFTNIFSDKQTTTDFRKSAIFSKFSIHLNEIVSLSPTFSVVQIFFETKQFFFFTFRHIQNEIMSLTKFCLL
eukprot:TRINITY_DN7802_c0_g3_i7.p1 TRINITY_DN7802_c0_g3~~TRINITY_DN7802_c0_g3_i7.p1  ORF type:complete len:242 (-),score=-16.53 TRINITY_DN7802_c0_g3_i7:302-1027(-)